MSQGHLADIQQLLRIESDAIAQTATRLDGAQVERVVELSLPMYRRRTPSGESPIPVLYKPEIAVKVIEREAEKTRL